MKKIAINEETKCPEYFDALYDSQGGVLHRLVNAGIVGRTHMVNKFGKITRASEHPFGDHNTPWHMTHSDAARNCVLYIDVLFPVFNIIAKKCEQCWKVVAKPQTVSDLIRVKETQILMAKEDTNCWCKCGIEERDYVHGNYGAYWYNNSIEDGLRKLDWVRSLMKDIDPNMEVFLKRGCTEIEHRFGDPTKWEEIRAKGNHQHVEDLVTSCFANDEPLKVQPDIMKERTQLRWMVFANDRGDSTAKMLNGGRPYIPDYMRFEKSQEEENVKEEKSNQSCTGDCAGCDSERASDCNAKLGTETVDSEGEQSVQSGTGKGSKISEDVRCRDNLGLLDSTE